MANFKFSLLMLRRNIKDTIFYELTLIIGVFITFIFINLMNHPYIKDQSIITSGVTWSQVSIPMDMVLTMGVVVFCCSMIFFANNFYMKKKEPEIAIMTLSGNSPFDCIMYIVYQILTLLLVACVIAITLGYIIAPFINQYFLDILGVTKNVNYVASGTIGGTVTILLFVVVLLTALGGGYIYRNDIASLLSRNTSMELSSTATMKMRYIVYIFIYLFGIVMFFMQDHFAAAYIIPTLVGVFGIAGIVKKCFMLLITLLKKKFLITKKYALIAMSNLTHTVSRCSTLFVILTLVSTCMISVIAGNKQTPKLFYMGIIGYSVIIVMMVISIVYKVSIEASSRTEIYNNLWQIGYTKKQLRKIVRMELFGFYSMLLLLPIVYIGLIVILFVYYGDISLGIGVFMILAYCLPVIIGGSLSVLNVDKIVVKPIKEIR